MKVAIGIGSNLGDREQIVASAVREIGERIACDPRSLQMSSVIETSPLPIPGQPEFKQSPFLNAAVVVDTELPVHNVLAELQRIECEHGRDRSKDTIRWGPRTLDLDILAVEDGVFDDSALTIPHPEMHNRWFVLQPLAELWPEWKHPLLNKTALELRDELAPSNERVNAG